MPACDEVMSVCGEATPICGEATPAAPTRGDRTSVKWDVDATTRPASLREMTEPNGSGSG